MKLGGLIGSIVYYGPISPFRSLINVGELLHVGKGTSFGLGKYLITK
jgi:CRISPR/Cas system endoribonuclease Cas6 (RAMP superfamily)